jgi:predicted nucleic acid-binding protein
VETLTGRLKTHHSIGLDTSIFIYHLENHPRYRAMTSEILDSIERGERTAFTSTITLMELTVRPWKLGREDIAREYEAILVHFPNLQITAIDRGVARQAARLRAQYNLRPPDALQVAACVCCGVTAWITNDSGLTRLKPLIDIIILDECVNETAST